MYKFIFIFIFLSSSLYAEESKEVIQIKPNPLSIDSYAFSTVGHGIHRSPVKGDDWNAGASTTITYTKNIFTTNLMLQYSHLDNVELIYGFIDIGPGDYGIRLGRNQNIFGFYNKAQNIPYLNDWIMAPPSVAPDVYKNLATQITGVQLYKYFNLNNWEVKTTLGYGLNGIEPAEQAVYTHFSNIQLGKFNQDKSTLLTADFQFISPSMDLQWYINLSQLRNNFQSNFNPYVKSGDAKTELIVFGSRYYFSDKFDLTYELINIHSYGGPWNSIYKSTHDPERQIGTSLSARYKYNDKLSFNGFVDLWCYELKDCEASKLNKQTITRLMYSRAIGADVVYSFDHDVKAKLQFTYGEGEAWVYFNDPKIHSGKDWNSVLFQLSKKF